GGGRRRPARADRLVPEPRRPRKLCRRLRQRPGNREALDRFGENRVANDSRPSDIGVQGDSSMNVQTATLERDITPVGSDYEIVRRAIELISLDYRQQPTLDMLAEAVGETPSALQKLFTRWAGLTPKGSLQAVTLDHARKLLDQGAPLLDAAFELGMSGPGRLH